MNSLGGAKVINRAFDKEMWVEWGELEGGRYFIGLPMTNINIEYTEYYEIRRELHDLIRVSRAHAFDFIRDCCEYKNDRYLLTIPSLKDRGHIEGFLRDIVKQR